MRSSLGLLPVALSCVLSGASQSIAGDDERQIWILFGDTLTDARTSLNRYEFHNEVLKSVFGTTDDMAVFLELKFEGNGLAETAVWQSLPKSRAATALITLTNLDPTSARGQDFQALRDKLKMPK